MPAHIDLHPHIILDRNAHQGRRVDFEVRQLCRNCAGNVNRVSLHTPLKGNLLVLGTLPCELNLQIGVNCRVCQAASGSCVRTLIMGNSAPRAA